MSLICIICSEKLVDKEEDIPFNIKSCGHVFHEACLKKWLQQSSTCPICRIFTINSPPYIGKLHFQRLSQGNSSNFTEIFIENERQKKLLEEKSEEIATKEEAWLAKEREYKESQLRTKVFLSDIHKDLKQIEAIREKISTYTRSLMMSPVRKLLHKPSETSKSAAASTQSSRVGSNSSSSSTIRSRYLQPRGGGGASRAPATSTSSAVSSTARNNTSVRSVASLSTSISSGRASIPSVRASSTAVTNAARVITRQISRTRNTVISRTTATSATSSVTSSSSS